jgi:hypothetical protein
METAADDGLSLYAHEEPLISAGQSGFPQVSPKETSGFSVESGDPAQMDDVQRQPTTVKPERLLGPTRINVITIRSLSRSDGNSQALGAGSVRHQGLIWPRKRPGVRKTSPCQEQR